LCESAEPDVGINNAKSSLTDNIESSERHSTTRTIRIDSELDKALIEIAAKERISVNSLINNSLRKYAEWDNFAIKFGVITNFTVAAKKIISYLTDDQVKELGKWVGENVFRDFIIFWNKSLDLESVLHSIKVLGSSGNYLYEEYVSNGNHTIICKHNLGPKWSLYYETTFKSLFEKSLGIKVETACTEDQIVMIVPPQSTKSSSDFYQSLPRFGRNFS
jgi:predicted DNA-binding ribbon-helix-helix protein